MRSHVAIALATVLDAGWSGAPAFGGESKVWPRDWPVYRHIVIVLEENKDYDQIVGNPAAPYLNQVLRAQGANLTRMYGEEHLSEGNYFWLLSGSNQGVGFRDETPGAFIQAPSLGGQLFATRSPEEPAKYLSFKGYAEDLPEPGSLADTARPYYARKHAPYVSFRDLHDNGRDRLVNLPFKAFPTTPGQFDELPTVAMVIPDLINDMHGVSEGEFAGHDDDYWIHRGDEWLRGHLDAYYQWARTHDSLLIVTFDENTDGTRFIGPTNPALGPDSLGQNPPGEVARALKVVENRIPTLIAGAYVNHGDFGEGRGVNHVNLLRTLEAMYGLPGIGAQQVNAAKAGIDDRFIWDVFAKTR